MFSGHLAKFLTRYDALRRIERFLVRGNFVATREIQKWTTCNVGKIIALSKQREKNKHLIQPDSIREYLINLQRADISQKILNKSTSRDKRSKNLHLKLQALRQEIDRLYCLALENLDRSSRFDPSILIWLDRPLDLKSQLTASSKFESVPRVRPKLKENFEDYKNKKFGQYWKLVIVREELKKLQPIIDELNSIVAKKEKQKAFHESHSSELNKTDRNLLPRQVLRRRSLEPQPPQIAT